MAAAAAAATKSLQSCPTLCDPIDSSPPGSPVPGILQARTLEWVAISFSNAWKWKVKVKSFSRVWLSWPHGLRPTRLLLLQLLLSRFSCVQLCATPWTAAHQAPLSMGFSRPEYWSGVPLPSPLLVPSENPRCCVSNKLSCCQHLRYVVTIHCYKNYLRPVTTERRLEACTWLPQHFTPSILSFCWLRFVSLSLSTTIHQVLWVLSTNYQTWGWPEEFQYTLTSIQSSLTVT